MGVAEVEAAVAAELPLGRRETAPADTLVLRDVTREELELDVVVRESLPLMEGGTAEEERERVTRGAVDGRMTGPDTAAAVITEDLRLTTVGSAAEGAMCRVVMVAR